MKKICRFLKANVAVIVSVALGAIIGLGLAFMTQHYPLWQVALLLVWLMASYLLHIVIHEGGHLVGGLLSGYRFVSFRVWRFTLVRRQGKFHLGHYHIPGSGGQCLLAPPEGEDAPVMLYNLSGGLANVATAGAALLLAWWWTGMPRIGAILFALGGLILAGMNLIPLSVGGLMNDGKNACILAQNPAIRRSFLTQLWVVGRQTEGQSLGDMPQEWFVLPEDAPRDNALVGAMDYMIACRRLDEGKFSRASLAMGRLSKDGALAGIHRDEAALEHIYCGLMLGREIQRVRGQMTPHLEAYSKSTEKFFPARPRQAFAWALLVEGDEAAAAQCRRDFEKLAAHDPYVGELETERRLMAQAELRYGKRQGLKQGGDT